MEQQLIARQIAYIVQIKDLLAGNFTKEDNINPGHVKIGDKNVSRVNIIGAIIGISDENNFQSIVVDDGTGKISMRNFEKKIDISVGDVVLLVGRIREFGNERYISPEIINKNISQRWSIVWKELALKNSSDFPSNNEEENVLEEIEFKQPKSFIDKILGRIRDLDSGDGASYTDIVKNIHDEKAISGLLLQGEVFEIKPGKLKVLD
jgi:RPA family protein